MHNLALRAARGREAQGRRFAAPIVAGLCAVATAFPLTLAPAARAGDGRSGATASLEPVLGSPVDRLHLIGASGSEIWGYGTLRGVPAATAPSTLPDGAAPRPTVFVVYRPGEGWQVADEPRGTDGAPLVGFQPLGLTGDAQTGAGSADEAGDLAVLGLDAGGDVGLLVRAPGERFRLVPSPRVSATSRTLLIDGVEPLVPLLEADGPADPPAADPTSPAVDGGAANTDAAATLNVADGSAPPADEAPGTTPAADLAQRSSAAPAPTTPSAGATATPTPSPAATLPPEPTPTPSASPTPADAGAPTASPIDGRTTGFGAELKATEDIAIAATASAPARYAVLAVREPGGAAGALVGVFDTRADTTSTKRVESSIFHWDGAQWVREAIQFGTSDPLSKGLRIVAIGGTGLDDAWLLARATAPGAGGIALFRREIGGVWKQRSLGTSPFAVAAPVGTGVTGIAPLARPAQALTVGPRGVWVDGSFSYAGASYPFTIYVDRTAGAITGSWCDAPVSTICLRPLGAALMTSAPGYRSFAFDGGGPYGQRIITNALRTGGGASRSARLALDGTTFTRLRGLGRGGDDAAFSDPNEGWLVTPTLSAGSALVHVTDAPEGSRLQNWPVPARRPLLAVTGEPGAEPGAADAQALAVGVDGTIARYVPGDGWRPEFLQNGEGVRQRPTLRGVAWPEANRAHAVGDDGAMWVWRSATGLWEPDASKPLDFFSNLMGVAFDPADPARGYAVGRQGTLLRYGKTWEQESLPEAVAGKDLTAITFAGRRAYAVFRDPGNGSDSGVLVNDGSGWAVDQDAAAALGATREAKLFTIHGLADGGVVAGGNGIVLKRSSAAAQWRLAPTPPTDLSVVAIRAIRESGALRAVIAAYPRVPQGWPYPEVLPPSLPGESPQLLPAIQAPLYGTVLREGRAGQWLDERHKELQAQAVAEGDDLPADNDQVYALELNDAGTQGWAVGGYVNRTDDLSDAAYENARRRAAAAFRYPADPNVTPSLGRGAVPLDTPRVRFAFGGHASCRTACADSANLGISADVGLRAAIGAAGELRTQPYGPRAFLYSGPRLESGLLTSDEADRFAEIARTAAAPSALPFYASAGPDATAGGAAAFRQAFGEFGAPFGSGAAPLGVQPVELAPRAAARAEARTHYAFDSTGAGGVVRVIVVDNSAGSLAASDGQNAPAGGSQRAWLIDALDDARRRGVPAIVVGNRDADALAPVGSNTADDAREFAQLLVEHGASAYLFDAPGINRTTNIPVGAAKQIPQFGNGTIGRASPPPPNASVAYYGEAGYLMVEVDTSKTDPATNVAPVTARLIPVLDELSIDPNDGVLLRRGKVTRWSALGRRPRMGDIDPYQAYPPTNCRRVACPGRIEPEFTFTSSRPDIADFVRQDTRSLDDHAIRTDASGKPIADPTSGLLCAYNGGTTDITIQAGGLTYTQRVTVQSGAVGPPCGTRPLANPPQSAGEGVTAPSVAPQDPAAPATSDPASALPISVPPPPGPVPATPATPPTVQTAPLLATGFLAAPIVPLTPTVSSLVPPSIARPLPPPGMTGVSQPVVEEKREEEEATESSQAYAISRPHGEQRLIGAGGLLALILLATGAAGMVAGSRRRPRPHTARARVHTPVHPPRDPSPRRRRW